MASQAELLINETKNATELRLLNRLIEEAAKIKDYDAFKARLEEIRKLKSVEQ